MWPLNMFIWDLNITRKWPRPQLGFVNHLVLISLYSFTWIFLAFWDNYKYKNMNKITEILENVVRCKYSKAGVHIKNPIKNSYQDDLGRTTQTLDHVVMVHILIWDKRKFQINEYNDWSHVFISYEKWAGRKSNI